MKDFLVFMKEYVRTFQIIGCVGWGCSKALMSFVATVNAVSFRMGRFIKCIQTFILEEENVALGNIMDENFVFPERTFICPHFRYMQRVRCEIKNNHHQQFGYDIGGYPVFG